MKTFRNLAVLGVAFALSACAGADPVSRNVLPFFNLMPGSDAATLYMRPLYHVTGTRVTVSDDLRVSEANMFYPMADIVWRGEQSGDRRLQVKAIYEEALARATEGMTGTPEAVVEIEVTRFHALTEKARYTVGGVHSLHFTLTVRDARSGAILDGPRKVVADMRASGGAKAIAEDQAGRTQRVVIVEHLAELIRRQLSAPVALPESVPTSRLDAPLRLTPAALPH